MYIKVDSINSNLHEISYKEEKPNSALETLNKIDEILASNPFINPEELLSSANVIHDKYMRKANALCRIRYFFGGVGAKSRAVIEVYQTIVEKSEGRRKDPAATVPASVSRESLNEGFKGGNPSELAASSCLPDENSFEGELPEEIEDPEVVDVAKAPTLETLSFDLLNEIIKKMEPKSLGRLAQTGSYMRSTINAYRNRQLRIARHLFGGEFCQKDAVHACVTTRNAFLSKIGYSEKWSADKNYVVFENLDVNILENTNIDLAPRQRIGVAGELKKVILLGRHFGKVFFHEGDWNNGEVFRTLQVWLACGYGQKPQWLSKAVLRQNLECIDLLLKTGGLSAEEITDSMKFISFHHEYGYEIFCALYKAIFKLNGSLSCELVLKFMKSARSDAIYAKLNEEILCDLLSKIKDRGSMNRGDLNELVVCSTQTSELFTQIILNKIGEISQLKVRVGPVLMSKVRIDIGEILLQWERERYHQQKLKEMNLVPIPSDPNESKDGNVIPVVYE